MARQGTAPGSQHLLVDVTVDETVQRVGATRSERATDDSAQHQRQRRYATLGKEHHRHCGEQQELDDAGFGERDIGADHFERPASLATYGWVGGCRRRESSDVVGAHQHGWLRVDGRHKHLSFDACVALETRTSVGAPTNTSHRA